MTRLPWWPLDAAAWLRETAVRSLTPAQRGWLVDLLCYCWLEGGIPADRQALLALLPGASDSDLDRVLASFGPGPDGMLVHARLDAARAQAVERARTRSAAARTAALARHQRDRHGAGPTPIAELLATRRP